MFRRSDEGLANEHLFYGVDYVVYCEGKASSNKVTTLDESFWHRIFSLHDYNVKCKSKGSKEEILKMAGNVIHKNVGNVLFAMDRDYDDPYSAGLDHPCILYTFGYSWESDVVDDFDFAVATSLFASAGDLKEIKVKFGSFVSRQSLTFRRASYLDAIYFRCGEKLYDRTKPMSVIVVKKGKEPELNKKYLLSRARNIHRLKGGAVNLSLFISSNGLHSFYGKAVAHMIYHWFGYIASKLGSRRRVPYLSFLSVLIATLSMDNLNNPRNLYYRKMLNRI